ncbi:MAG: AAA family ATPase [Blastocatellia bacterium]
MNEQPDFHLYAGDGTVIAPGALPLFDPGPDEQLNEPADYLAEPGLRNAVNVALALGHPLLLTGEPGTGKTQLSASLAHSLGLGKPLEFHVKTTSTARDLFYRYDSLGHFHRERGAKIEAYLEYEALGLAVLLSLDPALVADMLPADRRVGSSTRSVVLIDEIDKAPRDLPNDVLNEIERMEFTVRETSQTWRADKRYRPIVVLTSNSEKNLPDAFLRRCVFYHIEFPDRDALRKIIQRRVRLSSAFSPDMLDAALARFAEIREMRLKKAPATAELLAWVRILDRLQIDVNAHGAAEALAFSYSALAKNEDDLKMMRG